MSSFKLLTTLAWICWITGAIMCATHLFTEFGIGILLGGGVCMAVRGKRPADEEND